MYTKDVSWFIEQQIIKHSRRDMFLSGYLHHGHVTQAKLLY